ncbi:MAG TPA: YjiH family protein [Pseudogracilibacillus sp.]|nr:YjiH family protein [Pseudogracilibacillus sp.]
MNKNSYKLTDHLRFIIPSVVGVFLFMMPITTSDGMTIPVALLADVLQDVLEKQLSSIMMVILVITAILSVIAKIKGTNWLSKTPFFHNLLHVSTFWTVTRVLAAIFAIMVLFELGPVAVYSEDTGGMILHDLLHVLFAVFLFAGLFLPLLMNFGLLEMFGTIMTKVMRPLFKIPGRSSIDALASWIGDGTIGVLLTSKQYEDGFYTKREAAVIGTTFSVVSITFSLVVISEVDLSHMFIPFYISVVVSGIIAAIIMPRIPPLSLKKDTDINGQSAQVDETVPEGENMVTFGYKKAIERSQKEKSLYKFFKEGIQNVLDMWMGVAPIVMGFGLIALIIAEYTPVFAWLGAPFVPLLEVMQVPFAAEASETLLVGFADMFLPSVIGASIEAEMTRFIVAAVSVSQLIYMSEVGGLLLGTKIPVSFIELFIIFLLRTIITLPIIVLFAHIIF